LNSMVWSEQKILPKNITNTSQMKMLSFPVRFIKISAKNKQHSDEIELKKLRIRAYYKLRNPSCQKTTLVFSALIMTKYMPVAEETLG